jgi:hypothetical protein
MSKLRTITIDPQFLSISKKKSKSQKTNVPLTDIKLNSSNIRELLLEKLKQHKKNKKTLKNPMVQLNTMDEQIGTSLPEPIIHNEISKNIIPNNEIIHHTNKSELNKEIIKLEESVVEPIINDNNNNNDNINNNLNIQSDRPYGILKNGNKPTYKNWVSKDDSNNKISIQETIIQNPIISEPLIQEIEVNKVFHIGRNKKNKTVSVLLKNNNTRKKIENDKINFKKTNITTVKNFLKKQNLIKFGTTAPNNLLRELYESTKLCGEITNENNQAIIHNFNQE